MKENKEDIFWKLLRIKLVPDKEGKDGYTEGVLFDEDDIELCDTLEDCVRDRNADGDLDDHDEGKAYGQTAIPYGAYELTVTHSPRFKRLMTLINNVRHFKGIRIHWGRYADRRVFFKKIPVDYNKEMFDINEHIKVV